MEIDFIQQYVCDVGHQATLLNTHQIIELDDSSMVQRIISFDAYNFMLSTVTLMVQLYFNYVNDRCDVISMVATV